MTLKSVIKTGVQKQPPRIVLHGIAGVGKTTFAAQAPAPIFLPTEDGLTEIDVPHFPVATNLQEVWDNISLLISEEHGYKTFVLDTVDWLEKLIWGKVCEEKQIKSLEELGFGKGYVFAMTEWDKFYRGIDKLRAQGMAILLLAHNEIKIFNPPDGEPYDRYQIKLNKHAAAKLEEWADCVLFANFVVYVDSKNKKATGSSERVIHTTNRPAWRAKTRYVLPDQLPLDFDILIKHIKNPQEVITNG